MSHRGKTHGGDAAALRAVWFASELTWGNNRFEVSGDGVGGAGEDAVRRGLRWVQELTQGRFVHIENGVERAKAKEFRDNGSPHGGCEYLWTSGSDLRCEDAHPDLLCFGAFGPKLKKPLEISGLFCDLAGDGAVDRNARLREVLQYTLVSRRCATYIVFGLQTVDGDDDVEPLKVRPMSGDGAKGAGNDLDVNAAAVEFWEDGFELAVAHEGIATDERDVERLVLVDDAENIFYKSVFFVVG